MDVASPEAVDRASLKVPRKLSMKEFVGLCARDEPMREASGDGSLPGSAPSDGPHQYRDQRSEQLAVARQQLASLGCGQKRRGSDASVSSTCSGQSIDSGNSDLSVEDMETGLGPDHVAKLQRERAIRITPLSEGHHDQVGRRELQFLIAS